MLLINRILLILGLTILPLLSLATPVFTLANEAYQNKDFPQAISLYKESLKTAESFSQHFNLGNAYYENKQYGHAVLHYEKALTLEPRNAEAHKNLQKAYDALQIHPEKSGSIELFTDIFSANTWTWIAIVVVLVGFSAFCFLLFVRADNTLMKTIMWSCLFLCVLLIGINIFYVEQTRYGIVLNKEAQLRISPTNASPITTLLLEGSKPKVIKTKEKVEGFVLIKTPSNKEGWISTDDFGLIWYD